MQKFTEPIIKGVYPKRILPDGTALVLEGGGARGTFSAGVFDAFLDKGIMFPYIAGISAGAAKAISYVSGQRGRNRVIVEKFVQDKKYISYRNFIRYGSLFGYDFVFNTIPKQHLFWDSEVFYNTDIQFLTGTTDCNTGDIVWFEKHELNPCLTPLIASCSVPMVSPIVEHNGLELLDGGVVAPIPIEKSITDGNKFHVIILTRNKGYRQKAIRFKRILNWVYGKYPALVEAILKRHEAYNRQIELCERLVQEKKAIIIQPQYPVVVGRTTTNRQKLLALYNEGHMEGWMAIEKQLFV